MNDFSIYIVFIHVLSAVLSVGPLFVLFVVLRKMQESDRQLDQSHISIFRSVVRLIKHAGHVLVGSGVLLIIIGPWPWYTSWIVMTIALMVVSIFFLARAFSSILKKFDDVEADRFSLISKLRKATWIYIILLVLMLALMVIKPTLW
ncbi:DUF2269 family protein [Paenisporosarcina sp. HGH0030]|uniref:DUF2269 family protein n=1 Tax=Paenisporosarcina sp. HGH0030 TaxID=1078085 RepID=UPI000561AAAB|nr:DUF2269 family protein [Paenisporosarcina sp. HGH0030]